MKLGAMNNNYVTSCNTRVKILKFIIICDLNLFRLFQEYDIQPQPIRLDREHSSGL